MAGDAANRNLKPAGFLLLFLLLSLALYAPVLSSREYVYDGKLQIERLHAPFLGERPLAERSAGECIAVLADPVRFGPATSHLSWRPLTALTTIFVDSRLFRETPALSLALNLLLHGLNAWLLFLCLRRFLPRRPAPCTPDNGDNNGPAAAGAFLFLLHPLNSEAVLCAGFRPDLVSATLILAATLLLLPAPPAGGGIGRPTALRLAAAAAVTAAALLFKEIAAAAVVLLPLLLLLKPDGGGWKTRGRTALVLAAVLAGVFAIFLAAWFRFRAPVNPSQFLGGGGRALGVANGITALWEIYAHRLAWPWPLRVAHPFEPVASLAAARFLWAAAATAGLLAAAAFLFRRNRTALFGLAWTAVCFLPYLQLVPIPDPVAERFAYVPMAGVAMLVAALAWQFRPLAETRPPLRRVCLAVGIGLALLYAGMDLRRSLDWRTDIGLNIANWEEAGDTSPAALENLGALYQMKAHGLRAEQRPAAVRECLDKAGEALARLRAMRPQNVAGWRLSAAWAAATGRPEEARAFIREALRLSPGDAEAREMAGKLGVPETGNG